MWFRDIIMLIAYIICGERKLPVYLEIRAEVITCLDESVKPIWLGCQMQTYGSLRYEVLRFQSVSECV